MTALLPALILAAALGGAPDLGLKCLPFKDLPYPADSYAPVLSKEILYLHHGAHHLGYARKADEVLAKHAKALCGKDLETTLRAMNTAVPAEQRPFIKKQLGQHYNHELFFDQLAPVAKATAEPDGPLAVAVKADFGSLDELKKKLEETGAGVFGSGWAWLYLGKNGKLAVVGLPNEQSPLTEGLGTPLLTLDVWEHAYYLQYKNKRTDFLSEIWKITDWKVVSDRYRKAIMKQGGAR
jgi:Fe-Mn family superoxide dismutase